MKGYAYTGCRTTKERGARGKGIGVYEIAEDGTWNLVRMTEGLVNPSYLCMDRTKTFLYTVHGDCSEISSFRIDPNTGLLTFLNTVSTGGTNPVHLSVDRTNRWIFTANLQTGTVAVILRQEDGSLGALKELYDVPGKEDGTISHPHQVMQDRSGKYLIVSCQGRKQGFGQVKVYRIDSDHGCLQPVNTVKSREIAEPRHLVFHPGNRFCYGVNEKDYSITYYQFDEIKGILTPMQILPTLPDTYTGDGWASGIVMEPEGRFVIVSNRKHDSITCFRIDQESGFMTYKDCISTGGEQPRFITMDADGRRILAANELSDTIRFFDLDQESGALHDTGYAVETESPVCVIFR